MLFTPSKAVRRAEKNTPKGPRLLRAIEGLLYELCKTNKSGGQGGCHQSHGRSWDKSLHDRRNTDVH